MATRFMLRPSGFMTSLRRISPAWTGFSFLFLRIRRFLEDCISSRANALLASPLLFIRNIRKSWRNESIAIRHLNFRQRLCVQHVVFLDDVALGEDERGQSVHFIRAQRSALTSRHGAVDKVPDSRSIRPVTTNGSDRFKRRKGLRVGYASYYTRANLGALTVRAVAYGTFRGKDWCTFLFRALPERESLPVRPDRDIPSLNFLFRRRPPDIRVRGRLRQRRGRGQQRDPGDDEFRKAH